MSKKKSRSGGSWQPAVATEEVKRWTGLFHHEPSEYLGCAILVLGCFILFLPLVANYDYYQPHIFLKSILFRAAVQAMAFVYVVLAIISPAHRPRLNRIAWILLAWFGFMLLSSLPFVSANAWKSWWGDFARMDGMFTQLHLLAYFLVLVQTFRKQRDWLILFNSSLFASVLMGFIGIIQAAGVHLIFRFAPDRDRIEAATGNPDFFGSYMLLNFCIVLCLLARRNKTEIYPTMAKAWFCFLIAFDMVLVVWDVASEGQVLTLGLNFFPLNLVFAVLNTLILLWFFLRRDAWAGTVFLSIICVYELVWLNRSQTRAAAVGLAAALIFVAVLYLWKGTGRRLKWTAATLVLLFTALPAAILLNRSSAWVQKSPLIQRLSSTSFAERRFKIWKVGIAGILDRPLLGWGQEQYHKAFDLHAPVELFVGPAVENWDDRAHNIILDVGTTTGLLGLTAFIAFYATLLVSLIRGWLRNVRATEYLSVAGLLVGYLVQNQFIFDTVNTNGILFLVLAYATFLCRKNANPQEVPLNAISLRKSVLSREYLSIAISAGVFLCAWHYLVREPLNSNRLMQDGIRSERVSGGKPGDAHYVFRNSILDDFLRAEKYRTTGLYEVREEFANYAAELVLAPDVVQAEKTRAAKQTLEFLNRSILEDPLDSRHYMYAATFANRAMDVIRQSDPAAAIRLSERGLLLLQKAEELGPNRPRIYQERAQFYMNLGRKEKAIAAQRRAIALDPDNKSMHLELAGMYILAEQYSNAADEWRNKIKSHSAGLAAQDFDRLIALYALKKQFASVVALYIEQLQISPNDPVVMARLAVAYREAGDKESARKTAREAAKFSPKVAADLEEFLKTLDGK